MGAWNTRPQGGGKVYIETRHDGSVTAHEGYLPLKDIEKIERILKGETAKSGSGAVTGKPEKSGPMAGYIALHRHAAVRVSLCDRPGIALRLAVAHLVTRSGHWRVDLEDQRTRKEATAESLAASAFEKRFAEHRAKAQEALSHNTDEETLVASERYHDGPCEVFARLLDLSDAQVFAILAVAMGETLQVGSPAVEAAAHVTGTDFGALWSPDDAFFDLLRDKRVINEMVADIAALTTARSVLTETGKAQKQVIRNRIAGAGCEPNPDWRPRWMMNPPSAYLEDAPCPPADAWALIAGHFETGACAVNPSPSEKAIAA